MKWLVLGGGGALGGPVMAEIASRGWTGVSASRESGDLRLDVCDLSALDAVLAQESPDAVMNCAAIVDIPTCEAEPGEAYAVNARPLSVLARWANETGRPLIQVSTDQYFALGDGRAKHDEGAPITLLTEYARTKFAAEAFALTAPSALVVRTNMAAARGGRGKISIAEWAFDQIDARAPMTLFDDYFCSTLDAPSLATAMFDLVETGARGLINVASSEVSNKFEFIHALADAAGVKLDWAQIGSAAQLEPRRAIHVGLDVSKAERLLGRPLPGLAEVARNFAESRRTPS